MKLLAKMYALVATEFQEKFDLQGRPYFEHCDYVKTTCGLDRENDLCIALGHDLIEDTKITSEYLVKEFNHYIGWGIEQLTFPKGITDEEYLKQIHKISYFKELAYIKMADLRHNMDASRLKGISEKDVNRMRKYMEAYTFLSKSKNY